MCVCDVSEHSGRRFYAFTQTNTLIFSPRVAAVRNAFSGGNFPHKTKEKDDGNSKASGFCVNLHTAGNTHAPIDKGNNKQSERARSITLMQNGDSNSRPLINARKISPDLHFLLWLLIFTFLSPPVIAQIFVLLFQRGVRLHYQTICDAWRIPAGTSA